LLQPAVEGSKDLTLKAVYSRSFKSARTLEVDESQVDIYSDDSGPGKSLDDLLARSDIKAVIIALPIKNQPEYIRKVLLKGKHVLSEKPVTENVKEGAEMIKWYHSEIEPKGVTWSVAENVRYTSSFEHAAEAAKGKGRQLTFRVRMQTLVEGGKYFETE
jgi:predicted dehydrogenase